VKADTIRPLRGKRQYFASILHPEDGLDLARLRQRHERLVVQRIGTSVIMGLLALGAYWFGLIRLYNLLGVAVTILFIAAVAVASIAAQIRIRRLRTFVALSILDHCSALFGYTCIMYALGGMEALYLAPIYTMYVLYVATNGTVQVPLILASASALVFSLMVVLTQMGFIPQLAVAVRIVPQGNEIAITLVVIALFYVNAFLAIRARQQARVQRENLRLQNLQLAKATNRAVESNRLKDELLSNVSHELRTPLNHILGFSQYLQDGGAGALGDGQLETLADIVKSSRQLASLIDSVTRATQRDEEQNNLRRVPIRLGKLCRDSVALVSEEAAHYKIVVSVDEKTMPGMLIADEQRLAQALSAILLTSVAYTHEGGSVCMSATQASTGSDGAMRADSVGDDILISIETIGLRLDAEDAQRIFEPFGTLKATPERSLSDSILNLYPTRRTVELHGGKIWIESHARGSVFRVYFPASFLPPRGARGKK
jgi:signal transduction histidine kinase